MGENPHNGNTKLQLNALPFGLIATLKLNKRPNDLDHLLYHLTDRTMLGLCLTVTYLR